MTAKAVRRALAAAGAILVCLLAAVPAARAQGFYYKEIRKDDRIYVFNDAAKAEAFEKTGEMGVGITRLGAGPNGETVVADSEQALDLFFFKHGIAQVVERPKPPTQIIEWRDGKTRITTNRAYLEVSTRIQVRYTHELPDDSDQLPGTGGAGRQQGQLPHPAGQVQARGLVLPARAGVRAADELDRRRQRAGLPVPGGREHRLGPHARRRAFRVKFGQFKAPFGRQQLTSSGAQQFVDRASPDGRYNPARETGLALWGTLGTNEARLARDGLQRQRPHAGPQRQRQVPVQRAGSCGRRIGEHPHEPVGLGPPHDRRRPGRLRGSWRQAPPRHGGRNFRTTTATT